MRGLLVTCVTLLMIGACDTTDTDANGPSPTSPSPTVSVSVGPQPGLPSEVAEVRNGIVSAADAGDYEMLQSLLEPELFLSDYGFGVDPIPRWEETGDEPLVFMRALLSMGYAEENTNEGHLYRWPAYDANTKSLEDISPRDRRSFLSVMSRKELRRTIPDAELGYIGPRLGILADGTWWFFILEPGP